MTRRRTSGGIILRLIIRHLKYPIFLLLICPLRFSFPARKRIRDDCFLSLRSSGFITPTSGTFATSGMAFYTRRRWRKGTKELVGSRIGSGNKL